MEPILHPSTRAKTDTLIAKPPHGILITGFYGPNTLAKYIARKILNNEDIESHPYCLIIKPKDNKAISIEEIRSIERFLSLKVLSKDKYNRVVIIEDAQNLSLSAQNALLKTIEEPPIGTIMILSANSALNILPTVRSRLQLIVASQPPIDLIRSNYMDIDEAEFNRAYSLSAGNPEVLDEIINNNDHKLIEATKIARDIISKNIFERLLMVNDLSKDTSQVKDILFIMQQMAEVSLKTTNKNSKQWQKILTASFNAQDQINKNAQIKLVLENFFLEI